MRYGIFITKSWTSPAICFSTPCTASWIVPKRPSHAFNVVQWDEGSEFLDVSSDFFIISLPLFQTMVNNIPPNVVCNEVVTEFNDYKKMIDVLMK